MLKTEVRENLQTFQQPSITINTNHSMLIYNIFQFADLVVIMSITMITVDKLFYTNYDFFDSNLVSRW